MELKAHFSNIHKVIIDYLGEAQVEIVAAIAWFTDRDIFEVLCKKSSLGTKVSVALIGDEINKGPGGLNFQRLINLGGKVTFLPPGSRDEPTMHHKFCVIDRSTVITGSYNWSHKARSNDENITVVTESTDFASKYLDTFNNLLIRIGQGEPAAIDVDAVRRRLELIRSLILLGEQEDISNHVSKLRPTAESLPVSPIIAALDKGAYREALEQIDAYLRRATALVVAGYADIPRLRFQLESLELRLESLTEEKADLERRLITFSRRHDDELGDVIRQLLKARAEMARLLAQERQHATDREEAETDARNAEEAYQDYSRQHEELQRAQPVPLLDEAAERELKSLYRKACGLCHPDKVTEERKEAAHRIFVQLQDAYRSNDLCRVREIHETLKEGGLPCMRSITLSEAESLRGAIAEVENAITRLVAELNALLQSEGVRLMGSAGATETEWEAFFAQKRETLEKELSRVISDIQAKQIQEQ